jgi:hypothetical protein
MAKKKRLTAHERQPMGWAGWPPSDEKKLTIDNIRTIKECELYVSHVFWKVQELHGEKEARRIFAEHGNWPAKRELKLLEDAHLLLNYLGGFLDVEDGEAPSVRAFVAERATKIGTSPDAMERKVWRVLNDENLWEYLYEEGYLSCPWPMPEELLAQIKSGSLPNSFLRLWGLIGPR